MTYHLLQRARDPLHRCRGPPLPKGEAAEFVTRAIDCDNLATATAFNGRSCGSEDGACVWSGDGFDAQANAFAIRWIFMMLIFLKKTLKKL